MTARLVRAYGVPCPDCSQMTDLYLINDAGMHAVHDTGAFGQPRLIRCDTGQEVKYAHSAQQGPGQGQGQRPVANAATRQHQEPQGSPGR